MKLAKMKKKSFLKTYEASWEENHLNFSIRREAKKKKIIVRAESTPVILCILFLIHVAKRGKGWTRFTVST